MNKRITKARELIANGTFAGIVFVRTITTGHLDPETIKLIDKGAHAAEAVYKAIEDEQQLYNEVETEAHVLETEPPDETHDPQQRSAAAEAAYRPPGKGPEDYLKEPAAPKDARDEENDDREKAGENLRLSDREEISSGHITAPGRPASEEPAVTGEEQAEAVDRQLTSEADIHESPEDNPEGNDPQEDFLDLEDYREEKEREKADEDLKLGNHEEVSSGNIIASAPPADEDSAVTGEERAKAAAAADQEQAEAAAAADQEQAEAAARADDQSHQQAAAEDEERFEPADETWLEDELDVDDPDID